MRIPPLAAALALLCGLTGCSASAPGTVTVFAASSLTGVTDTLTGQYSQAHPDTEFAINFGSSAQLVEQVKSGARAEVLVTADEQALDVLGGSGLLASEPVILASNSITLALAPGNPAGISALADLERAGATVARCAPAIPCGRATERVLQEAGITLEVTSVENDVRSVLTKVTAAQVAAGFVYATDIRAAQSQGVRGLALNDPQPNRYPAVLLAAGADEPAAHGFYQWLAGEEAAQLFGAAGFGPAELQR